MNDDENRTRSSGNHCRTYTGAQSNSVVVVNLNDARVDYTGGQDRASVEAEIPDGWAVDWSTEVKIRNEGPVYSATLVRR